MSKRNRERGAGILGGLWLWVWLFLIVLILALVLVGRYLKAADRQQTANAQVSGVLAEVEATEFEGVELTPIAEQGNNAVEGTQYIDKENYQLSVTGLVENVLSLSYDQLIDLPAFSRIIYMPCVEGWGFTAKWTGIKVMDILDMAVPKDDATYVVFHCNGGTYSTGHYIDYLRDDEIMMAYGLNDMTLPADRGFPFQLVADGKYGYKWAKWITGLEIVDEAQAGYWEKRGYSDIGDIDEPGWVGTVSD